MLRSGSDCPIVVMKRGMPVEQRGQAIAFEIGSTGNGRNAIFNGRRQPSCGGTNRMTRECQVRICERLGVKFPGPSRPSRHFVAARKFGRYRRTADKFRADAYMLYSVLPAPTAPIFDLRMRGHGSHREVLTIRPVDSTNQRSLLKGLALSRATSQSATKTGGKGPRLAAGTFPTECRLSA